MLSRSHLGVAKPGFLLVHPDFPSRSALSWTLGTTLRKHDRRMCFLTRLQCYVRERNYGSRSDELAISRSERVELGKRRIGSSSLYSRPSLSEMKNERIENRAKVYEFLRGIGIVPDELDGLELPVTVEVMKERVDFLHNLGLTIDDINNYPLVLGCSVKKNMIPVLDYLGILGVRKSTFVCFLRRYPQVLHASVAVDLAPVVKYLQGMDIKPNDIPRVLEKYPEVLGFKLEGTMSTSVAYLVGIGVARREIGGVLTRFPQILGMRVGRVIKPFVEYLEGLGIPRLAVARLIEQGPHILGFGLEDRVKPNVKSLLEFQVRRASLPSVVAQYPEIIGIEGLEPKLQSQNNLMGSIFELNSEDFGLVIERMPQVIILKQNSIVKHVDFLKDYCSFSMQQKEMKRPLDDLVAFPAFFTYGLESTIKPRHNIVVRKGIRCSLSWLLNCSESKFRERMDYEGIDMDEMVPLPSFDMKMLMEQRDDESGSDCDEDSEED
ncbi:hypothetical protein SAY87_013400 [Trapa incisa]|uniref:Transcription termination factor MTERF4, chloroplastic n=1 Tax=Trapa incisa TaxID=236973 RepID=A0AAN7KDA7_9MYRT|nr:hypothetical protein SAY87_013400 [Trapa incisa]